jgi:predicted signal transduction protein with EAL and GGDEF domain
VQFADEADSLELLTRLQQSFEAECARAIGADSQDEFTVILADVDDKSIIASVCRRIIQECAAPIRVGDVSGSVTASIGICRLSDLSRSESDSEHSRRLLVSADGAMYRAKRQGKNAFVFYDEKRESVRVRNHQPQTRKNPPLSMGYSAVGESRTPTSFRPPEPESGASTNSATTACEPIQP